MPALDDYHTKKTHLSDRNTAKPTFTLCGLRLDEAGYYEEEANFERATCVTCRRIFFPIPGDLP